MTKSYTVVAEDRFFSIKDVVLIIKSIIDNLHILLKISLKSVAN